jgi:hypothetical protein
MNGSPPACRRGPLFWLAAAAGWALMAWGVRGILIHRVDTRPRDLARFFAGGVIAHDLVFAPLLVAGGLVLRRVAPRGMKASAQAALFLAGTTFLFAYPGIRRYARVLHNPTSIPHHYLTNAALVAGAAVAATAAVALVARKGSDRG